MKITPTQDSRRLRHLRIKAGLTQQQLADRARCTKQTVSGVERGTANFSAPMRVRIEEALGLEQGALMLDQTEPAR